MKKLFISLFVLIFSSISFAQDKVCDEWKTYDNGKSFSCLYWTTPYKAPTPIYQEACKTVTDSYGNPQTHCQKLYKHGVCSAWDIRQYKSNKYTAECISYRTPQEFGQRTTCQTYITRPNSNAPLAKKQTAAYLTECKQYKTSTQVPTCDMWQHIPQEDGTVTSTCRTPAEGFERNAPHTWIYLPQTAKEPARSALFKRTFRVNACQKYKISKPYKDGSRKVVCASWYDTNVY